MGKQFNNGIWSAVQFLVCSHNETELAKQLVEESGLTMKDCLKAQKESGFEDVTMLEFINSISLLLMISTVASVSTMKFVRIVLCTVVCYRSESQRGRNRVSIMKSDKII